MHWDKIAGHEEVVAMLRNMLAAERVPHAVLFAGPTGLGKRLVADVLAAALLCDGETASRPCGCCASCRQLSQGTHPDLVLFASDGTTLKIDQIRQLQHEAALTSYHGRHRVVVLEEAERMTNQAANSLLKVLEEPPAGTVFILTAASVHVLLPTIVSRCRVMQFRPLPQQVLASFLAGRGFTETEALVAARLGGGRVGTALALLAPDGLTCRNRAVDLVAGLPAAKAADAWETAAGLDKLENKDLATLLDHMAMVLRDLLVLTAGQPELVVNQDVLPRLQAMSADWEPGQLRQAIAAIGETRRTLETNANTRLACEALWIKLLGFGQGGI